MIDHIATSKLLGFSLFIFFLWLMFEATFVIGEYPKGWIDSWMSWMEQLVQENFAPGPLADLLTNGIINSVGGIIVFLPQILILYFFILLMEDFGYMVRTAFIMDKLMHKMGLHGKSFILLIMGFGCNVLAVMATRTIESRSSRMITMLAVPLMSCSARLPLYVLICRTFFCGICGNHAFSLMPYRYYSCGMHGQIVQKVFIQERGCSFCNETASLPDAYYTRHLYTYVGKSQTVSA